MEPNYKNELAAEFLGYFCNNSDRELVISYYLCNQPDWSSHLSSGQTLLAYTKDEFSKSSGSIIATFCLLGL